MKFSQKNIENWQRWKMSYFLVGHFDLKKNKKMYFFLVFSHENNLGFHARYHFFEKMVSS